MTPSDQSPVRLALIGAGVIGRKHLQTIAENPSAELVGLADPAPGARELAIEYGVPAFQDAARLIAETRPQGVVVATPTEHHLEPALLALEAGAHVLVEKPITARDEDADTLAMSAKQAGRQILVGQHRRHYPVLEKTRALLASETIGRLITVHGHWTLLKDGRGYWDPEWRKRRAAGPVLTNLIHEFDTLRFLCGEIRSVQAETSNSVRDWEKEDSAAVIVRFANGALGTFILSDGTPSPWAWELATGENPAFPASHCNTHRFTGTKGALEFPNLTLWQQSEGTGWHHPIEPQTVPTEPADAYAAQCTHFCAVIRGECLPKVDAEDGAKTLRAVNAVFLATETGRRVDL